MDLQGGGHCIQTPSIKRGLSGGQTLAQLFNQGTKSFEFGGQPLHVPFASFIGVELKTGQSVMQSLLTSFEFGGQYAKLMELPI